MNSKKIFVGRKDELNRFEEVLQDQQGQAVLVVGQAGMGKTWLVNKMAEISESHPKLKCGWVRYEVTPTDSVDSTMTLMMDNAFEAAQVKEGSFDGTNKRLEQWKSLLNVIKIGDLVMSLRRDPTKNTRDQFLERLRFISNRMPDNGRAIFIIDPEKYMQKESDQSWAIVVKELPEKIKFLFSQRPEDVLVESETFGALKNVLRIPDERLNILDEESVDELLNLRVAELQYSVIEVRKVLGQYKGHPYALQGSLDLLKAGMKLEELPKDPTGIASSQWKELRKRGKEAIRLFKAYVILEVGVPFEVVEAVSDLDTDTMQSLLADNFLWGLLRDEGEGKRIYHAILADYILGQISLNEKKAYHGQAVGIYREKLAKAKKEQIKPDALAAMRLAEHVLVSEGQEAFVDTFGNECAQVLINLGSLDTAIGLSERVYKMVKKGSKEEARILRILGVIYDNLCEFDKAVKIYCKALEIDEGNGNKKGMSIIYGNLGVTYCRLGELTKAEDVIMTGLKIDEQLRNSLGMASKYSNLGLVYKTRGEFYNAQKMYQRSLEIFEGAQRLEEVATVLGNIGTIYTNLGDINGAEKMYKKALLIDEKLGRLEGISRHSSNLGVVYKKQGDIKKAEQMFIKSMKIDEKIDNFAGMATNYGNLGVLYQEKGESEKAEEMQKKALEIDEKIGCLEGVARHLFNLGLIVKERGNISETRKYWEKALRLYRKIGMSHMVKEVEEWIEGIEKEKNDSFTNQ